MAFTITNFLDDVALYQNITRLPGETNEDFTSRIIDFSKVKFGTDYLTQIQSVMLQSGLRKTPIIELNCDDPYEIEILPEWIIFKSFYKENLILDYGNGITKLVKYGDIKNYFRVFVSDYSAWKNNLLSINQQSNNIKIDIIDTSVINGNFLLRNKNTNIITEVIDEKRTRLLNKNIIPGSFRSSDISHCGNRVSCISDIKKQGDYFLDDDIGYLELYKVDIANAFHIEYKTYNKTFIFYKTQLSLQSLDYFTKYGLNDKFIDLLPNILYNKCIGE